MKKKIIQICGANGSGKTTLVKNLLRSRSFSRCSINVGGVSREYWYDGSIAVIGVYNDENCCGIDRSNYRKGQLEDTIERIISRLDPDIILFEGIIIGTMFSFKQRISEISMRASREYLIFNLVGSPNLLCERVYKRSGNKNCNYDAVISKQRQVINSSKKAVALGAKCIFVDIEKEEPQNILLRTINV